LLEGLRMGEDEPDAEAEKVAERVQSYVYRGRKFGSLSADELMRLFVVAYRKWARDIADRDATLLTSDLHAEYHLRKLDIPFDLVKDQIDIIREGASRLRS
jgi:hypothetical protein